MRRTDPKELISYILKEPWRKGAFSQIYEFLLTHKSISSLSVNCKTCQAQRLFDEIYFRWLFQHQPGITPLTSKRLPSTSSCRSLQNVAQLAVQMWQERASRVLELEVLKHAKSFSFRVESGGGRALPQVIKVHQRKMTKRWWSTCLGSIS